jgi:antitoxin (DNA-binding transcriptional repressor) of toxin-antitoxin stability system
VAQDITRRGQPVARAVPIDRQPPADLLHTAHFLTSLGDARYLSALPQPEQALAARSARRLCPELARLGEALNRCLVELAGRVN